MATNLPDITARVRLDTTDLEKGVGKAAKAGAGIGAALGTFTGQGLAAGVAGLKDFAKGAVDAFAAVEDATGAASVEFGKALPSVLDFAAKAASGFGLSKRAALEAQNTFGTLGKAAGLTGQPLADFSQKLTGLAGDLASFKGTSTEQAITAVGAALRGESEPIRAYGVLLDQASIEAEAAAIGLAKPVVSAEKLNEANLRVKVTTLDLTKAIKAHGKSSIQAEKAQSAYERAVAKQKAALAGTIPPLTATNKTLAIQSLILKQTKDASGDYQRTAHSTANVQKTLAAETENAQAALGQKLAPTVTALRIILLGAIRASTGLFTVLNTVARVLQSVAKFIKDNALVLGLLTAALAIANAQFLIMTVRTNAQVAAFIIQSAITKGITAVTEGFAAAQVALNLAMEANPIGLIIALIVGLIAVVVLAYKHSETFRNIVDGAFRAVKVAAEFAFTWIKAHWPLLLAILTGPVGLAVLAIVKHRDTIVNALKNIPNLLKGAFTGLVSLITSPFIEGFNFIAKAFNSTIGKIHFNIPHVGGFDVPDIPLIGTGSGGGTSGPGLSIPSGRGAGYTDDATRSAGLHIHGNIVLQGHQAAPDPESLVRGLQGLAFTSGF